MDFEWSRNVPDSLPKHVVLLESYLVVVLRYKTYIKFLSHISRKFVWYDFSFQYVS